MNEEMKMQIFEYLRDNLQIQCNSIPSLSYYSTDRVKVMVQLRNPESEELETIASDDFSIE